MYTRPCFTICHACGDECRLDEITTGDTMRDEALSILGVRDESTVCLACAERAEREVDEAEANAEAEAAGIFEERAESYRASLDAMLSALGADHDAPALPWSLAWCREDGAMAGSL